MSDAIIAVLLRANLVASVAILVVLALRRPVLRRLGADAAYALWMVAPASVIGAFLPGQSPAPLLAPFVMAASAAAGRTAPSLPSHDLGVPCLTLWAVGALAAAALVARRQARFLQGLGCIRPSSIDPTLLVTDRPGIGPAVVGALRPVIVVPADFDLRFQGEARRVVLAHERIHLARGDAAINAIAAAAQCLAWFNPLIHFGVRRMRMDQELSCDAAVVARFPHARRVYAQALLDTQLASQALPFGCHWPAAGHHPLKERMLMLNSRLPGPGGRRTTAALVAALGLTGAGLAWPADAPRLVTQPQWIEHPTAVHAARYYPTAAANAGLTGDAVIGCNVAGDGRLRDCSVLEEAPARAGFGDAALQMSPYFKMATVGPDGVRTSGGRVRIPIRFAPSRP